MSVVHEQAPEDLLAACWDGTYPVDPFAIAQNMGARVVFTSHWDAVSGSVSIEQGVPTIAVNGDEAEVRQRFTMAHEIGHLALGHVSEGGKAFRDTPSNFSASQWDPLETDANRFAADLLMPAHAVEWAVKVRRMRSIREMADFFHVSGAAMEFRLKNLGYLRG